MTVNSSQAVLVLIEPDSSGQPSPQSLRALSFARQLCELTSSTYGLCWLSPADRPAPSELLRLGATEVIHCDPGHCPPLRAESCVPKLAALTRQRNIGYVLAAATTFGRDVLPRLAGLLDTAYVSDCTGVVKGPSGLRYVRPVYAGSFSAECESSSCPTLVSVRASAFALAEPVDAPQSALSHWVGATESTAPSRVTRLGFEPVTSTRPALADASIVVAGGRALKERFFEVLGPLADCLGAAIGATRAACDESHVPSDYQVGQTGKVVAPKLYIAVGLSGSVQHLAGMRGSHLIVAINLDPEAPIFGVADFGLVGDLFELVPALTAAIRRAAAAEP